MSENNGTDGALKEVEGLLQDELQKAQSENKRSMIVGGVLFLIVVLYLGWANSQVGKLLDPEGLALAATGVAMEAVPQAGASLEALLVDGAPDLAKATSQSVIDALPVYRAILEDELRPVIDEVNGILAQAAVKSMVTSLDAGGELKEIDQNMALQDAADAVVLRLDVVLKEAMDEPLEDGGPSPRDAIEASLVKLTIVDRGLKQMARRDDGSLEREFLMAWMGLANQYSDDLNAAAEENYRVEGAPPEPPE